MALWQFIFRCPLCGHDPMTGKGDLARCPSCACEVARGAENPSHLRLRAPEQNGGTWTETPAAALAERLEALGGAVGSALDKDGRLRWASEVIVRRRQGEHPVRWKDQLLGFFEAFAPGTRGTLHLVHDHLRFVPATTGPEEVWNLLSLRSLQSASSSIQFTTEKGDLMDFTFAADSPRRWEALLRDALNTTWQAAGRGEIVEVQPRIRVRLNDGRLS